MEAACTDPASGKSESGDAVTSSEHGSTPGPADPELWGLATGASPFWSAIASGQARLRLSGGGRPGLDPLRMDYDFGSGSGFVVARVEVDLVLTESWALTLKIRGAAPANTLEIKLVDPAGTSVWRWKREGFLPPGEWTELRVAGHAFEFAWGPVGGGAPSCVSALEVALVAPPGGCGFVEIADLRVVDRGLVRLRCVLATSGAAAEAAVDGDDATCWQSDVSDDAPALTLEFAEARDMGGLEVRWGDGGAPRSFSVQTCGSCGSWTEAFCAAAPGAPRSFVPMAVVGATALRIAATGPVAIAAVVVKPHGWSRTPSEFLTNVAKASRRGEFPRYFLREQSLWTPVAAPTSGPLALLGEDGAVEVGEGGFSLEPSLVVGRELVVPCTPSDAVGLHILSESALLRTTWADVGSVALQEESPLPVPTVRWKTGSLELDVTAVVDDLGRVVVRYRVRNGGDRAVDVALHVAARPFQVTPPWQAYRGLGGPARLEAISCTPNLMTLHADGRTATLVCSPPAAAAGATCFDAGGLAPWANRDEVPPAAEVYDPHAMAEGVFRFPLRLASASFADVFVACAALAPESGSGESIEDGAERLDAALVAWRCALPLLGAVRSEETAFAVAATATAHVLACRDGVALQPGPRRYTRSWIRDGAIMAASLARAGRSDAARDFVDWYVPFQRDDGFVPCCVDRDGADPLVEHDSHGQLIHAVAETYRFTRDGAFAARHWPACARASAFLEALRDTRRTADFVDGPRRACFGLLPESVSHEGYLAQPVHAYWDDFWALRGLRDAAFLAKELGLTDEAARWAAAAADLGAALTASVRIVMRERQLQTLPASVEWADFDPTAIAGVLSLTGGREFLPPDALEKTFDRYMDGFRARRDPSKTWSNYSPYEARIVGALVHMGRRDDANEVLDALLADCRPRAWRQWPEILWRDASAPAHLGDLPHCWIGAEFVFALRTMLVFEREDDGALVIGAGLTREWLEGGLEARGLPTWWGNLDLAITPDGCGGYRVAVGGGASPPGGIVAALPGVAVVEAGVA